MAALLDMTTGNAAMAYVGQVPWHGLGNEMVEGQSLDQWRVSAGIDFTYQAVPVLFTNPVTGVVQAYKNRQVLTRSDTGSEMSIVSGNKYKIVQPGEILEFYRDLINAGGFEMHTAGALKDGKVVWALAKIGDQVTIMGQDRVDGFLLLASSCDGLMATRAMFTSVRVVCNNTLQLANSEKGGVRVPHSKVFDADMVRAELGVGHQMFEDFGVRAERYANVGLAKSEAAKYIARVMSGEDDIPEDLNLLPGVKNIAKVIDLFSGAGMGADLRSSRGTVWGALNAITEWQDHHAGRGADSRLTSSWLGQGRLVKDRAVELADRLVAAA